jgi:hypothetical protein
MTPRSTNSQKFSLVFVESIRQRRVQRSTALRRFLSKRPAAINALMSINKSDLEIQHELQTAFTRVAHGPNQALTHYQKKIHIILFTRSLSIRQTI